MQTMTNILSTQRFFADLPRHVLEIVSGCASNIAAQPGVYLMRTGDPADYFYLVRGGRVAIELTDGSQIQSIEAGDVLGWYWFVPPYSYAFDARVTKRPRLTRFDARCLRDKCAADHELGYYLFQQMSRVMVERLQAARLQLADLYR